MSSRTIVRDLVRMTDGKHCITDNGSPRTSFEMTFLVGGYTNFPFSKACCSIATLNFGL
jgi:hypothetical protein